LLRTGQRLLCICAASLLTIFTLKLCLIDGGIRLCGPGITVLVLLINLCNSGRNPGLSGRIGFRRERVSGPALPEHGIPGWF
jgi:hypothetical protein